VNSVPNGVQVSGCQLIVGRGCSICECDHLQLDGRYFGEIVPLHTQETWPVAVLNVPANFTVEPEIAASLAAVAVMVPVLVPVLA